MVKISELLVVHYSQVPIYMASKEGKNRARIIFQKFAKTVKGLPELFSKSQKTLDNI